MPFTPSDISDWFWDIVERSSGSREQLDSLLRSKTREEILRFQDEFLEAAAQLKDEPFLQYIDPVESEDGLDDICNWVVSRGRVFYSDVWENPHLIPKQVAMDAEGNLFGVADDVFEELFDDSIDVM